MHTGIHAFNETLAWLLEPENPGVRYLALRDLLHTPAGDFKLETARRQAFQDGPIAEVLDAMHPDGYWAEPGPGYLPKYTSTVWAVILLAQLGASSRCDERVAKACLYLLDHNLCAGGKFSITGAPSGTVDCLQGNLCWALRVLEVEDPRLEQAETWMARSVTGEGVAPASDRKAALRYYAGKCGPGFACGANNGLPCAWGAVKVMMAFGAVPPAQRTALVNRAAAMGISFLLDHHPAQAEYPNGYNDKPSGNWWKFGFPVFYVTDLLQVLEAAAGLGYLRDDRLSEVMQLVLEKQDLQGRWSLEYDYAGKTYGRYGEKKMPGKWVTLRALRVINAFYTLDKRL